MWKKIDNFIQTSSYRPQIIVLLCVAAFLAAYIGVTIALYYLNPWAIWLFSTAILVGVVWYFACVVFKEL